MRKRKPCGYYWRLKNKMVARYHDNDLICLKDYTPRQRVMIVHMAFKWLPRVKFDFYEN